MAKGGGIRDTEEEQGQQREGENERETERDRQGGRWTDGEIDGGLRGVRTLEGKGGRECEMSTLENQAASLFPREAVRLAVAD